MNPRERQSVGLNGGGRSAAITSPRGHRPDYWLLVITLLLLAIGLIVIYSISPALTELRGGNFVLRQSVAIGLSILAFLFFSRFPIEKMKRTQYIWLALAILGTLFALLTPENAAYPQHRWIRLGSFSLQSVEVLKFALIISVSGFLATQIKVRKINDIKTTLRPLLIVLAVVAIVVALIQSDLGSAVVIAAMLVTMAIVAGLSWRRLLPIIIAGVVAFTLLVAVAPYRVERLTTFLHPEDNCSTSAGHQACQALIAVGTGGMIGLGLGNSVQAYGYLPEAQNDSIFAIYAEKFGFVGVMVLLGLFATLFARLRLIAERAPDMFSRLVVVGVLTWLSVQSIINIGAMIGLLPLKGITLPLISYGGTSVLFVGAALGLVFQISRYTSFTSRYVGKKEQRSSYADSADRRRIRRPHHTNPRHRA